MNYRKIFLFCMSIFFLCLISTVHAQDKLPSPDPEGTWRVITQDPTTTTSKCIGDTSTPVCAMETFLACYSRHYPVLCPKSAAVEAPPFDTTYYRIDGLRRILTDEAIFEGYDPNDYRLAGDIEIFGHVLRCKNGNCDFTDASIAYFLTRKKGDGWVVKSRCIDPCD